MMLTTQQVREACAGADIVLAVYPDGENFSLVRGLEVLDEIIASGNSRELKVVHVPVGDFLDANRIRALLQAN